MPQIVCTKCLVYLTDHNVGDFHMCKECAWGADDDDDECIEDLSFFCEDCFCVLGDWIEQRYGQCDECRENEQRELNAMHPPPW